MLKTKFLKSKMLILTLLLVSLFNQYAFAATRVNVVGVRQINTNWCWAACCEAIFRGPLGTYISQTEVVREIMGPYLPNVGATDEEVVRVFDDFGYSSKSVNNFLDFATVKQEINAGRPIIAHLSFRNHPSGHDVVITTCDTQNGINYIWYMEPHTGNEYMLSFNSFVSGFTNAYDGDNGFWKSTVYGFKKK